MYTIYGFTFVYVSEYPTYQDTKYTKGDTIQLLKRLDFSEGDWEVYLIICHSDFNDLNPELPKRMCLRLNDRETLEKMRAEWRMKYTGGDVATVESSIIFLQNSKIKFHSGI